MNSIRTFFILSFAALASATLLAQTKPPACPICEQQILAKAGEINQAAGFLSAEVRVLASAKAELQSAQGRLQALMAEKIALGVELRSLLAMQSQAEARRGGLGSEASTIQQQVASNVAGLHDRYFADPLHLRRAHSTVIQADAAFREAQRWMFFTIRALEYKWNESFSIQFQERDWDMNSLFQARNMDELANLKAAVDSFNMLQNPDLPRDLIHNISLRDDLLAPFTGTGVDNGLRLDPLTRQWVPKEVLLRRLLERGRDQFGNVVIPFNTFTLQKDGFFSGAVYNPDGSLLLEGRFLDKIDSIRINVIGSHPAGQTRDAKISYGGTSYIRSRRPLCDIPPAFQRRRIPGEMTPYPVRFFFTPDSGATWESRSEVTGTILLWFSNGSWRDGAGEINFPNNPGIEFKGLRQRSVAAAEWELTIPAASIDLNLLDDIELWVSHRDWGRLPCK